MHFSIRETLSFQLMYVAACYPDGNTISKSSSLTCCSTITSKLEAVSRSKSTGFSHYLDLNLIKQVLGRVQCSASCKAGTSASRSQVMSYCGPPSQMGNSI